MATLCNLFNPQTVVVGGDLGAAGELLLAPLRESLRRGAIRSAADDVTVSQGELGERAEVLGSGCARARTRRAVDDRLTPGHLARNTSNSQIVAICE